MSTTMTRPALRSGSVSSRRAVAARIDAVVQKVTPVVNRHSIPLLRFSLGLVFLTFAAFKFVPGASPAEEIAIATVTKLTFGLVHGSAALLVTALTETVIGVTLLTGRFVKVGLVVMAGALVGIMSPLALFPDQMWATNGPTLLGQYVFKDIVLATGALVVAAHALGARLHTRSR